MSTAATDAGCSFSPDVVLPVQFDTLAARLQEQPERRLLLAVLTSAVVALDRGARDALATRRWVEDDAIEQTAFLAFRDVCENLQLDAALWRRALLAIPARPRGRQLTSADVLDVAAALHEGTRPQTLARRHQKPLATILEIQAGTYYVVAQRRQKHGARWLEPTLRLLRHDILAEIQRTEQQRRQYTRALRLVERLAA